MSQNANGECVCTSETVEIDGACVSSDAHIVSVYPWVVDGEEMPVNLTVQSGCKFAKWRRREE